MISVGRRDAKKKIALGFGGGGGRREMEETELEEGEACSYNNKEEEGHGYGSRMDPDIDLSYIDEKLQSVLGHFQKDFEGGVSAENLGPKFGGYGSFLPAYQRSPVWSHPRTPPKLQHYNVPRSPNNLQLEGGHRSSVSSTNAVQSGRVEIACSGTAWLPESKTPSSFFDSVKPELCMHSTHFTDDPGSRCESVNRNSATSADQKLLKVRIKVGSDNLSTHKNVAIYSGLGLVSPSSSLDDSPSESEGMSNEAHDALESPAHIIQIMTMLPVPPGLLLSPLADDLIQLTKKEKFSKDNGSLPVSMVGSEKFVSDAFDSVKDDRKKLGEKKIKSLESNNITQSDNDNLPSATHNSLLNKDTDLDALACEELVSNTLKLPLLSDLCTALGETEKVGWASPVSKEYEAVSRNIALSNVKKEEPSIHMVTPEDGVIQNSKATSGGKVSADRMASSLVKVTVNQKQDGQYGGEKHCSSVKTDSNVNKGRKAQNSDQTDPPKEQADQQGSAYEREVTKLSFSKENSDGKKKKGSKKHGNLVADFPKNKESLGVGPLFAPKSKKSAFAADHAGKVDFTESRLQKNDGKIGDRYKDFFGDMDLGLDENLVSAPEMSGNGRMKSSEVEKNKCGTENTLKERSGSKQIDKLLTSETYGKAASHSANGLVSDTAPPAGAPVETENWVCCDKCQQWRLLPLGKNPNDLPEKWLCSMLNWLPGMNQCSFTEEETTNALIALYQVPAPESQNGVQNYPAAAVSRDQFEDIWQHDHNQQSIGSHGMTTGGKKKLGLKELSNIRPKESPIQLSNSGKNCTHVPMTNGSLNDVKESAFISEPDVRLSKSGDLPSVKHKKKHKEKYKVLQNQSDKGTDDIKQSKTKGKRGHDQDAARTSKKIRTESLPEGCTSSHHWTTEKTGPSLSNGLLHTSTEKCVPKQKDCSSSKDSKYDPRDGVEVSYRRPRDEDLNSLDDKSVGKRKPDNRDVLKNRKMKERHYPDSLPDSGHHLQDSRIMEKEEFIEDDYRKEKKARISRSEGKETSAVKGNSRTEKSSHKKNQQVGEELGCTMSQQSMDGVDYFKIDSGTVQPSLAAMSSSSKVSGSHKTKNNFRDSKGSPVESVSSSPLRVSRPDKLASAMPNITGKNDSVDVGFMSSGGLKKFSDGEDDGRNDRSGTIRKQKTCDVAYHDSLESSIPDYQEKTSSHLSGCKAKVEMMPSNTANDHFTNGGERKQCPGKSTTLDRGHGDGRQNENHRHHPTKSGKGSSSRSKDRNRNSTSEFDNGNNMVLESMGEQAPVNGVKPMNGGIKVEEQYGIRSADNENEYVDKKDSTGLLPSETSKRGSQTEFRGHNGSNIKVDAIGSHESISTVKQCSLPDGEAVRKDGFFLGADDEKLGHCMEAVPLSQNGVGSHILAVNAADNENSSKAQKQVRKVDHSNGVRHSSSLMSNGYRSRDPDAPSPAKRDSSNHAAANALEEAKNLKHSADRVKNLGLSLESTRLYFEAALKFLHGASLLESGSNDSAKNGEMIRSRQIYSSTAKLCEFCAHEYEKSKEMAAAALAYKCMEVAYMKVIFSSHTNASRDRHELQKALQMVPPGESPSSSASDIDNLNHTTVDKAPLSKSISSPQVVGNHIIAAKNRPNFVRLLNYVHDVNFAMEASRKSQIAFAAANVISGEAKSKDGILFVKAALDFNFQDVEGLLHLVRLASDSISN